MHEGDRDRDDGVCELGSLSQLGRVIVELQVGGSLVRAAGGDVVARQLQQVTVSVEKAASST